MAGEADGAVAEAAISALGKIGDKAAWKAIADLRRTVAPALADPRSRRQRFVAPGASPPQGDHKLATAAYEELLVPSQPAYIRRAALEGLLRLDKDQGEQRISQVLRGSDAALKPVAIAAVRSLRSKQASAKFAAELPRLQPQEQIWMIDSLAARGDPRGSRRNCEEPHRAGCRRSARGYHGAGPRGRCFVCGCVCARHRELHRCRGAARARSGADWPGRRRSR